jgi:hypothetical protein
MAGGLAPIDFWGVFNAAAESSRARRLDEQRRQQMEHEAKRQDAADDLSLKRFKAEQTDKETQTKNRSSLADLMFGGQNLTPEQQSVARADPQAFAQAQQQQQAMQAKAQEETQARALRTSNIQKMIAQAPPEQRDALLGAYANAPAGQFDKMPEEQVPVFPEQFRAMGNKANAQQLAVNGPPKAEDVPEDPIAKSVIFGQGIMPNQPGFQEAYTAEKTRLEQVALAQRRAGAVNVNVGGKELPVGAVTDLADASNAEAVVGDIGTAFRSMVPAGDVQQRVTSYAKSKLPGTQEANYLTQLNAAAQVVGLFLEGGKLGEADVPRYRNYFPQPGDTDETAAFREHMLAKMIADKKAGRFRGLKFAGYKVPENFAPGADKQDAEKPAKPPALPVPPPGARARLERDYRLGNIPKEVYDAGIAALKAGQ